MREKNFLWILLTLMLLIGTIMVALPLPAQSGSSPVRIYVDMPLGYIPGVPAGGMVFIDIVIESPPEWEDTAEGIVGWSIYVKVDPAVLTPAFVDGAVSGCFLYDFCIKYGYFANLPKLLFNTNETHWIDVAEFIFGWKTLGVGAGGSGKMVTLVAISLSATAYSPIDIYEAYYYTIDGEFAVDVVEDGHYNQPLLQPPVASFTEDIEFPRVGENVTFTSTDADGTIVFEEWDLNGDGIIDKTGPVAWWIYDVSGDYNVTLTVTDSDDLKDTAWLIKTVLPASVHDIAITDIILSPSEVTVGDSVSINITVKNEGTETESFDISMYYDSVLIETQTSVSLDAGVTTTLTFDWNITIEGSFTIKAVVPPVSGETDTADNELFSDAVKVHETPAAGIPLYVLAAVVLIIVVVALAFYVFKVKKPTRE